MTPEEERSGDLLDVALAHEIELVSDLVVAASSSPRHFTPDEVDELLGIASEGAGETSDAPVDGPASPADVPAPEIPTSEGPPASGPSLADPAT
jgi:hypothetical protein